MAEIDIAGLDIEQLTDLLGKAQTEMASRERQRRKDLRAELERRVAADGYGMAGHLSRAGGCLIKWWPAEASQRSTATQQNPERTWSGIGRTPKWVQAILDERGIDVVAFKSIPMYQIHST